MGLSHSILFMSEDHTKCFKVLNKTEAQSRWDVPKLSQIVLEGLPGAPMGILGGPRIISTGLIQLPGGYILVWATGAQNRYIEHICIWWNDEAEEEKDKERERCTWSSGVLGHERMRPSSCLKWECLKSNKRLCTHTHTHTHWALGKDFNTSC